MPTNKEKSETTTSSVNSGTYKDKRKDYVINACFDSSNPILETAKRLVKNEITNSYLNRNVTK